MNDPHGDAGPATFTASDDPASEDAGLLGRIGQGDEDAMAAFYREHGRVVLSQVLLVTGERVLAEEIVQDTMLAVWRGAGAFRGESRCPDRWTRPSIAPHKVKAISSSVKSGCG